MFIIYAGYVKIHIVRMKLRCMCVIYRALACYPTRESQVLHICAGITWTIQLVACSQAR